MYEQLTDRMSQILQFVIDEYIESGEPVGSRTIAKKYNIHLSPATIRNIMSDLEDAGFLYQPYTSAGRVPTKEGFQYYVDTLIKIKEIPDNIKEQVCDALKNEDELKLSKICSKLSDIIANITNCIGLVVVPDVMTFSLKHIEFLKLSNEKILVIIVNELGQVQNKILKVDFNVSQEELNKLSRYLDDKFQNKNIFDVKKEIVKEIERIKSQFNKKILFIVDKFSDVEWYDSNLKKDIIIKGFKNFFDSTYFKKDVEGIKKLLTIFEEKNKILELIDKSIKYPGVQIFIGSESNEFEDISIVTSPYSKDGIVLGTLGVIGPVRMKYDRIIPVVDCAAQIITSILDEKFRRLINGEK
jgi:heat-inducible transcriptional repressor